MCGMWEKYLKSSNFIENRKKNKNKCNVVNVDPTWKIKYILMAAILFVEWFLCSCTYREKEEDAEEKGLLPYENQMN